MHSLSKLSLWCLSFQAMRDLQLANSLEARAIRLRQEALSRIILSLRGTAASRFLKFVIDTFGNKKDFLTAQAEAALRIEGDTEDEDVGDEVQTAPGSSTDADPRKIPDVCSIGAAKPIYPVSEDLLNSTGVPKEFISDPTPCGPSRVSTYFCLYGECKAVTAQKALMMTHVRRKHLGVAIGCKYCGKQWWAGRPFAPHMEKEHPELSKLDWYTPIDPKEVAEEEADEARKSAEEIQGSSVSTTPLM